MCDWCDQPVKWSFKIKLVCNEHVTPRFYSDTFEDFMESPEKCADFEMVKLFMGGGQGGLCERCFEWLYYKYFDENGVGTKSFWDRVRRAFTIPPDYVVWSIETPLGHTWTIQNMARKLKREREMTREQREEYDLKCLLEGPPTN